MSWVIACAASISPKVGTKGITAGRSWGRLAKFQQGAGAFLARCSVTSLWGRSAPGGLCPAPARLVRRLAWHLLAILTMTAAGRATAWPGSCPFCRRPSRPVVRLAPRQVQPDQHQASTLQPTKNNKNSSFNRTRQSNSFPTTTTTVAQFAAQHPFPFSPPPFTTPSPSISRLRLRLRLRRRLSRVEPSPFARAPCPAARPPPHSRVQVATSRLPATQWPVAPPLPRSR